MNFETLAFKKHSHKDRFIMFIRNSSQIIRLRIVYLNNSVVEGVKRNL